MCSAYDDLTHPDNVDIRTDYGVVKGTPYALTEFDGTHPITDVIEPTDEQEDDDA